MLEAYQKKYNSNTVMPLKAIVFYNDINFNEPIKMAENKHFKWEEIEKRLRLMHKLPNKVFEVL